MPRWFLGQLGLILALLLIGSPAGACPWGAFGCTISGPASSPSATVGDSPSSGPSFATFSRSVGLRASVAELQAAGLNDAGLESSIRSNALAARDSWPHTITPVPWDGSGSLCRPVGSTPVGEEYDLTTAAANILAMAIVGVHDGDATYMDAARNRAMEFVGITDLEQADQSAANQCNLDAPTAVGALVAALWLLEEAGSGTYTAADRVAMADWLADEVHVGADWAARNRKNNWGEAGLSALIEIAAFTDGYRATLPLAAGGTTTPAAFLAVGVDTVIAQRFSTAPADDLDSQCAAAAQPSGQQSSGGFPDELRRTVGTANCGQADLVFACGSTANASCANGSNAAFYQQKATNLWVRAAESLRRIDGNGARLFDLTGHGGSGTRLRAAYRFGTSLPGLGDFQGVGLNDNTQGARYVLGSYLNDGCIVETLDDGSVFSRGGRDMPYAAITHPPTAPPCSSAGFIPFSGSSLASIESRVPDVPLVPAVDTTGWSIYDPTVVGGTNPPGDADFTACTNLDGTGASDNSVAFDCMLRGMGDQALLDFPDGTYDVGTSLDGSAFFRPQPAFDNRGIIGGRGAVINFTYGFNEVGFGFEGEDPVESADIAWSGGFAEGATVLAVADTSAFSATPGAAGNWVYLQGDPNATQDLALRRYRTQVLSIDSPTQITIRDPLPQAFDGGNQIVRAWTPALNWVFRGLTIQYEDNSTRPLGGSDLITTKGMAQVEISDVNLNNTYQQYLTIEQGADLYFVGNDLTNSAWDKATNGYGVRTAQWSRGWVHDNHMRHVTGMQAGDQVSEVIWSFNDVRAPLPNPLFDAGCNTFQNPEDGTADSNDCQQFDRSGIHPPTQTAAQANAQCEGPGQGGSLCTGVGTGNYTSDAYGFCSRNPDDLRGFRGDASCRNTPAGAVYSCGELHDRAAVKNMFIRNYCEASFWLDDSFGPGDDNFFFGNVFTDAAIPVASFDTSPGNPGDMFGRDAGAPIPGYRMTLGVVNNQFGGTFGSGVGMTWYGDGSYTSDNVFRVGCNWTQCTDDDDGDGGGPDGLCDFDDTTPIGVDPTGGQCTAIVTDEKPGINTAGNWQFNTVGSGTKDAAALARTMPTLPPPFTAMPDFSIAPANPIPLVGPEIGDAETNDHCLPAWQRNNGGSC